MHLDLSEEEASALNLLTGRAYRMAMIAELWTTVASGTETTLEQRARCRLAAVYAGDSAKRWI